jgi:hypothetical protein
MAGASSYKCNAVDANGVHKHLSATNERQDSPTGNSTSHRASSSADRHVLNHQGDTSPRVKAHSSESALSVRIQHLEQQLFLAMAQLRDAAVAEPQAVLFTAVLGVGKLGMVVTLDSKHRVVITELKRDIHTGAPLQAMASGQLRPGDVVLALNGEPLGLHEGLPQVSKCFGRAARPLRLLVRRVTSTHVQL